MPVHAWEGGCERDVRAASHRIMRAACCTVPLFVSSLPAKLVVRCASFCPCVATVRSARSLCAREVCVYSRALWAYGFCCCWAVSPHGCPTLVFAFQTLVSNLGALSGPRALCQIMYQFRPPRGAPRRVKPAVSKQSGDRAPTPRLCPSRRTGLSCTLASAGPLLARSSQLK